MLSSHDTKGTPVPGSIRTTRGVRAAASLAIAVVLAIPTAVVGAAPSAAQQDSPGVAVVSGNAAVTHPRQGERQVRAGRRAGTGAALISAAELGLGVARETARHDRGWGDSIAAARMVVRHPGGTEVVHRLRTEQLEGAGRRSKLIVRESVDEGAELAVLSHAHGDGAQEQWIVRSPGAEVERVDASFESRRFLDSEFAFEDLAAATVDDYTYLWLRDETVDGLDLVVVERRPAHVDSAYTRQVLWIDRDAYRVWRIDFYDHDDRLLKTLRLMRYRQYRDAHWRPQIMHMANHRTGASTTLYWSDYRFETGLRPSDFDPERLKRLR